MQEFRGHLLIGGMTLKDLDGELDEEAPHDGSEWRLGGRMKLCSGFQDYLQVGRIYRLLLDDGRAGQVILSAVVQDPDGLIAEFCPGCKPR